MTISVRMRRDLVITDPERFLATARDAYREVNPGTTEAHAAEAVVDVYDAMHALLDRAGRRLAEANGPAACQI